MFSRQDEEEMENLNRPVTSKRTKTIKTELKFCSPKAKAQGKVGSTKSHNMGEKHSHLAHCLSQQCIQ